MSRLASVVRLLGVPSGAPRRVLAFLRFMARVSSKSAVK
jgi:hypothetical protein